jgi:hypothetical protein
MTPRFGTLVDLPPREAWSHEALDFTPWLAANVHLLAQAIGIPLELTDTEVAVDTFAADILARNPMDDTVVLIENQLETTDHTHLGQIMTYLAGLSARTVVWIAPAFREPHLSAIRWLNEHTPEGFSFFAVQLRLVRIADSPYAPIFDVLEKPNGWERRLTATRQSSQSNSALGDRRSAYWQAYVNRHPSTRVRVNRGGWISFSPDLAPYLKVVLWIGNAEAGIFVRPHSSLPFERFSTWLAPLLPGIEQQLGIANKSGDGTELGQTIPASLNGQSTWPAAQDWQETWLNRYLSVFDEIGRTASSPLSMPADATE